MGFLFFQQAQAAREGKAGPHERRELAGEHGEAPGFDPAPEGGYGAAGRVRSEAEAEDVALSARGGAEGVTAVTVTGKNPICLRRSERLILVGGIEPAPGLRPLGIHSGVRVRGHLLLLG